MQDISERRTMQANLRNSTIFCCIRTTTLCAASREPRAEKKMEIDKLKLPYNILAGDSNVFFCERK
jgi:hypothetical protein